MCKCRFSVNLSHRANNLDSFYKLNVCIVLCAGCPNTRIWPEVEALPLIANGSIDLPREQKKYVYNTLQETFPKLREEGIDMLHALLTYDPKLRPTARAALKHGYFYCSPYPQESDFMPTFPTQHDDMK